MQLDSKQGSTVILAVSLLGAAVVTLILFNVLGPAVIPPLTFILIAGLIHATLQMATPLVLGALGGMFSERSGVVNIGLEGMMLIGAYTGVAVSFFIHDPWLGLLGAMLAGGFLAFIHAIVCVKFKGNHIVSGAGIILLGQGLTTFLVPFISETGAKGYSDAVTPLPRVVFLPEDGGFLDVAFNNLSPIIFMMFVIVGISWYVLYKTPFGLRVRAAGEDPSTLDTTGVNVETTRIIAVTISGILSGMAGAYLSIGFSNNFGKLMTGGRGFIALAALIFGNWTPVGCLIAGLFFGFLNGIEIYLPLAEGFGWLQDYAYFIAMTPFILVIVALAGIRKSVPPKGIAVPYEKEKKG